MVWRFVSDAELLAIFFIGSVLGRWIVVNGYSAYLAVPWVTVPLLNRSLLMSPFATERRRSVAPSKRATRVADLIEADLMKRGWPVGEVIGTFSELIENYGVSRAVVREAIALLEHKMVVTMRHGPGGGVEVRAPVAEAVVGSISSYFDFTGVTDGELSELRQLLMGLATRLAAERMDDSGSARLRSVVDRARKLEAEHPTSIVHSLEVFALIAELSGNPAIPLLWSALIQRVAAGIVGGFQVSPARLAELKSQLGELVLVVMSGDARIAEARMLEFLDATYSHIAAQAERAALEESDVDEDIEEAIVQIGISMPGLGRDRRKKLPARVVRELTHEIKAKGLKPGDVIGMEPDLLERIGVSRSVFREAVRIIEFYGLAEMRRGPKGGLTVCEPDPELIEEAIITYLDYMGMEHHHLFDIRIVLEILNVEQTIARDDDQFALLEKVVDREKTDGNVTRQFALHQMLSELSGNRASKLLSNVLSKLIDRFVADPENAFSRPPRVRAQNILRSHEEHLQIVKAILARDRELARHRMRRHLQFIGSELDALKTRPVENRSPSG